MPPGGLPGLGLGVHAAPAADDALDVSGGAGAAHGQQLLLGLRGGHASERPHLGVRQLPAGKRPGQEWQGAERAGHADALARGARIQADAPAQPVGAGAEAVGPAAAGVELADQIQEAGGGGLEVRRQLGDLVPQPIQFCDGRAQIHG
jgi:hypothetical protein